MEKRKKNRKVISGKNLPMRLPIVGTIVFCLALDRIGAPGWVWGAIAAPVMFWWAVAIYDTVSRVPVEIIMDDE